MFKYIIQKHGPYYNRWGYYATHFGNNFKGIQFYSQIGEKHRALNDSTIYNKNEINKKIDKVENENKEILMKNPILYVSSEAINKMKEINKQYENKKALKIQVEAGGCSGFQYFFSLTDKHNINENDIIAYDKEFVIVINKEACDILKNSKIHYLSNLISKKFVIENIQNISSKCSCGNSFDIIF
ncbi:iron-sulfur assembly protein, putative [Plasmodium berghei]|uniref:Iron-sulfur assembly protein, putative n=2 Tax=Plasmodium berghei TaxID=5821 RepID=A0A509AF43_PLABA|nr:iron-sulfur assembly protein, putative [Plasmodium berghei ANKA]CXH93122.1 iron-sulfur assembly protein, putative [Plasmodium berghei]SCL90753.1 iron-sulfur assembly protein, putative [Plasmodium berghei]SCM15346.1 iron-sulfur assembly protein, putative [Plasmodium berghei]SCM17139.1 iron-sulfur assembly protein, putative [Plasmodium berghei]SCN22147.1 iron-sulfur assembly protein, putative [Plasmodium berghei]|eukprot:XP_034419930.1 iron-sulfur assembly protein, putative [Plasmodium berghei ANKA]